MVHSGVCSSSWAEPTAPPPPPPGFCGWNAGSLCSLCNSSEYLDRNMSAFSSATPNFVRSALTSNQTFLTVSKWKRGWSNAEITSMTRTDDASSALLLRATMALSI